MSPYMRAYEAGIKLAQLEWMSKVADNSQNMSLEEPNQSLPDDGSSEPEAPAPMSINPEPTDDSFGLIGRLSNLANMVSNAVSDAYQGSAPQGYVNDAVNFVEDFYQGTNPDMVMSTPQQAPAQQAPAQQAAPAPQAPASQAAQQQAEDDVERFEREQRELAMNTFNVQRGGYGRQLARFRQQFGEGNEDLFQGNNAIDYRDFARAMDNRGLQVGDTFDARDVLQNLRAMRSNQGPVEVPTPTSRVGVQRRGRDVSRFQTLAQQRAAAQQQAPANVFPHVPFKNTSPQRQPTFKPTSPTTPKPNMPQGPIGPHNIDQF